MKFLTKTNTLSVFLIALVVGISIFSYRTKTKTALSEYELAHQELKQKLIEKNMEAFTPFYQQVLKKHIHNAIENPENYLAKSMCWSADTDPRVVEEFHEIRHDLQNSLGIFTNRFQAGDNDRWSGTVLSGGGLSQGDPTILTWSYVPDGTTITNDCFDQASTSDFIAFFNGIFGGPTVAGDFTTAPWHTIFEDMFIAWENVSGLSFVYEPNDDGANFPFTAGSSGTRGDHRIGGNFIDGNSNILACNYFPNSGDMILDTGDNFYSNSSTTGVQNVLQHEIGHGLGLSHVCPVSETKLMEPFVSIAFAGPQEDDILAVNRLYGDVEENNNTSATATDLGSLALPSVTTRNTLSIDDNSDVDYFEFDVNSASDITITLSNTGSTYLEGAQNSNGSCQAGTSYDPLNFANLEVDLLASNGSTVLASANGNGTGIDEVINSSIGAGTFFVRIRQTVSSNAVQMYSFTIEIDPIAVNAPTASFTASNDGPIDICTGANFPISFTDTSIDFPDTWNWTFMGAGVSPTSSTDQFPTVTVSSAGTLTVTLEASNSAGTSAPVSQDIVVNTLPLNDPSCLQGCVNLNNLDLANNNLVVSSSNNGGYVSGSNGFNDEGKAEEFILSNSGVCTPTEITGVIFCAIVDAGTTGNVDVAVWDDSGTGGTPGTIVGSTTVDVNSLALVDVNGDGNLTIPTECAFVDFSSSPITVTTDKFYIGVTGFSNLSGGNIGIVTNTDGEQVPPTAWELWDNGNWFSYNDGSSWGIEVGHALFPELRPAAPTVAIDVPTPPGGFCNDGTLYTFSENATLCTAGAGTTETYSWTVSTGGTTVATGTNASENFSFSTVGSHDIELCVVGLSCEVNCATTSINVEDCDGGCPPEFTQANGNQITGTQTSNFDYETDGSIESDQVIEDPSMVDYDSALDILMKPGFEVQLGAVFHAFIDGCGGNAFDTDTNTSQKNNSSQAVKECKKLEKITSFSNNLKMSTASKSR